jgi:hypothetical protein
MHLRNPTALFEARTDLLAATQARMHLPLGSIDIGEK